MSSARPLRRRTALLQLAALTGLTGLHAGCAAAVQQLPLLDMQLVDRDSGAVLAQYPSRGRRYSPGTPGSRYAIRLSNRSGERVLVVLSVDGVNAITGDTAAFNQSGYVLSPGESHDITGWRKSDERIAAFEFTSLGDSYAARTGRPANVGVIGAAVFREVYVPPPPVVYEPPVVSSTAPAAPSLLSRLNGAAADAAAPARESMGRAEAEASARAKLGTGHGASEWSPMAHTGFQRRTSQPEQLLEIHYDSQANLMAAGIMPRPMAQLPRSFPNSGGYVPDPPPRW
ncbi:hypothetical protein J2X20_004923 [Pelomonas saccharophila]|uniref:Uncharacterized protein n=1 Tax=Roseateles saccharophilus TaxID=304 RepID=A0ABU1YTQ6_ROSSA|nr:hypothetical protein [Roseateles saccharophilus]MDR7272249.1 hypothetical protein [Roseateles saccharophilus]